MIKVEIQQVEKIFEIQFFINFDLIWLEIMKYLLNSGIITFLKTRKCIDSLIELIKEMIIFLKMSE